MQPDETLLRRWSSHRDAEAFAEIVRRHSAMVYAVCRRSVGDPSLAEDVRQDCFLKLAETADQPGRNLSAWLHRVATNRSLSVVRSAARQKLRELRARTTTGTTPVTWAEVEGRVDAAISALPDELRLPLIGHFLEGHSHRELARRFEVPRRTVSHRIQRAVLAVRAHLRKAGIPVSSVVLASWLSTNTAMAAPPALLASLSKLAVAGGARGVPVAAIGQTAGVVGGIAHHTAGLIAIAAVALLALGGLYLVTRSDGAVNETLASSELAGRAARDASPGENAEREPAVRRQADTAGTEKAASKTAVSGTVRTAPGDVPVQGATIVLVVYGEADRQGRLGADQIRGSRTHRTTTDAMGRYSFEQVTTLGSGRISAYRDGSAGARVAVTIVEGEHVHAADLQLRTGKTLRGRVEAIGGEAVPNAIVTVMHAHDAKDYTRGWGFAVTDDHGEFVLGLHTDATLCALRVNSDDHGQDFFTKVKTEAFAVLKIKARAILRGRVTLPGGQPAAGVAVLARAELRDPDIPVFYSGMRRKLEHRAEVEEDGHYEIRDLQPGLTYEPIVVAAGDKAKRWPRPLTPTGQGRVTLKPGEVREWDATIPATITVRGRVKTERSGAPVANVNVQVAKDGKVAWQSMRRTDAAGRFELRLTTGPGSYRFHAAAGGKLASEHFAVEKVVREGDNELKVDLLAPEPIVLPIRVTDNNGKPVRSIQSTLHVFSKGGPGGIIGTPRTLDDQGRTRILLYRDVSEVQLEVSKFPRGPSTKTPKIACKRGDVLAEQQISLHVASGIAGKLVDEFGSPRVNQSVQVTARYDDGTSDRFYCRSGEDGRFSQTGVCRAARAVFVVSGDGKSWRSDRVAAPPDGTIDLGAIRLQ